LINRDPCLRLTAIQTLIAGAVLLAGCSGGDLPDYTTEGITKPAGQCETDPLRFSVGESLGDYGSGVCTIKNAYRITAMEGVAFSQPAIVNCATANSFRKWLNQSVQPAANAEFGTQITSITIAASYACRGRNGRRGAKLSEHGFGNAIDVSAFQLADGQHLSVKPDYSTSKLLKTVRKEACGTFSTVLGPGSDSSHRDHLHFDLANRRSGQVFCH
jgi:hypothetical protein